MDIRIELKQDRAFLDVLYEVGYYDDLVITKYGRRYITYSLRNEWFNELSGFYQLRITSFRV